MKSVQPNRPKILIISGSYPDLKCGVGICLERLVENMMAKGVKISLLTDCDPLIIKKDYINALIKIWNICAIPKILSFINRERPHLINFQVPTLKYKARLSAISLLPLVSKMCFKATPFVVTVHDYAISRQFFKIFFLPLFLFSDAIVMTNANDIGCLLKSFPFFRHKVRKIRLGPSVEPAPVSRDKIEEFYKNLGYKKGDRFISTFGLIKRGRYIEEILKVFGRLAAEDERLKLMLLGQTQNGHGLKYKDSVSNLIESMGLRNKVRWLEYHNPAEGALYLSLSDLALLFYERGASFRRSTMINYIVRRIPVITNVNKKYGIDDELLSSGMVLAVDSVNTSEIYEKAKSILYNKDYADALKNRMAPAQDEFNWSRSADEMIGLCMELINRKKAIGRIINEPSPSQSGEC